MLECRLATVINTSQTRGYMGWYLDSVTYPQVSQVAVECYILRVLCILLTVT